MSAKVMDTSRTADISDLDGLTITHLVYRKRIEVGHMMASGRTMEERLADFGREAAADIAAEMLHRGLIHMEIEAPKDGGPRDLCTVIACATLLDPVEYKEAVAERIKNEREEEA